MFLLVSGLALDVTSSVYAQALGAGVLTADATSQVVRRTVRWRECEKHHGRHRRVGKGQMKGLLRFALATFNNDSPLIKYQSLLNRPRCPEKDNSLLRRVVCGPRPNWPVVGVN